MSYASGTTIEEVVWQLLPMPISNRHSKIANRKSAIPSICGRMKTLPNPRLPWEVAMEFRKTLTLLMLAMGLVFALSAWAQQKPLTRDQVQGLVRDGLGDESVPHQALHLVPRQRLLLRPGRQGKDQPHRQHEKSQRFSEFHCDLPRQSWIGKSLHSTANGGNCRFSIGDFRMAIADGNWKELPDHFFNRRAAGV